MKSVREVVDSIEYRIDAWGKFDFAREIYKFGIQAIPRKGQVFSFAGYILEELVEDEIDNEKKLDYLETVTLLVAENHLRDILNLSDNTKAKNIQWWFKEAKRQLDQEVNQAT